MTIALEMLYTDWGANRSCMTMPFTLKTRGYVFSIIFIIVFDVAYSLLRWPDFSRSNYTAPDSTWLLMSMYWLNAVITYTLLAVYVLKSRLGAYLVMPYFVIVQAFFYYLSGHYGLFTTSTILTAIFQTNYEQALSHIYPIHYIVVPVFLVTIFCGVWVIRRFCKLPNINRIVAIMSFWGYLVLTSGGLYVMVRCCPSIASNLAVSNDAGAVPQTKAALKMSAMQHMTNEDEINYIYRAFLPIYRPFSCLGTVWFEYFFPDNPPASESFSSSNAFWDEDLTVVFVVGESFRADHAPWNGYTRNTLPKLSCHSNIINFPYVSSYATVTITSIYGMISNADTRTRKASSTSFIGILKKHGFSTGILVSRSGGWCHVPSIRPLIYGCVDSLRELPSGSTNDEIARQFRSYCSGSKGRQFILVEDGCGHMPYTHQREFNVFSERGGDSNEINLQKYDNCLLQTDDLLNRFVEYLKDKNAILVYSSDHGQSFGEGGYYTHGGLLSLPEQRHVFTFIWYSNEYRRRHAKIVETLVQNKCKHLSHNHLFHTIISLCGIKSILQRDELDMTKLNPQPDATEYKVDGDL